MSEKNIETGRIRLAYSEGISGRRKIELENLFGGADKLFKYWRDNQFEPKERRIYISDKEKAVLRRAEALDEKQIIQDMAEKQIEIVFYNSPDFPVGLRELYDLPYCLFYKGRIPSPGTFCTGIVGSRVCTPYGERHALEIGRRAAVQGIAVVSGLARGIDAMGQRGAINGGGETYAVLGCGADVCYPKSNRGLYEDLLHRGGGILSEYAPGTAPAPWRFPMRNRIITALSHVLIVVEARKKSGALITADMAVDMGRDIYVLPGPVDSRLSEGCNRLISQGAVPIVTLDELDADLVRMKNRLVKQHSDQPVFTVCEEAVIKTKCPVKNEEEKIVENGADKKDLERTENIVYSCLCLYPKGIHIIIEETGLPAADVLRSVVSLEMEGLAVEIGKHTYIRAI